MFLAIALAAASLWTPLLATLNKSPSAPLPASQQLADDLSALNQAEMKAIKAKAPKGSRDVVNRFFHDEVTKLNDAALAPLKAPNAGKDYGKLAEQALAKVAANPVAKVESTQSYDATGQVGYCFGRALLVHLFLLQAGVPQDDMLKIFNLGDLIVEKQPWKFHVAVLVKDAKAGWLAVDPLQGKAMPYEEWIAANKLYDVKKKLPRARFYTTDPRKFLPSFGMYDLKQLEDPVLKSYFADLAKSLGWR